MACDALQYDAARRYLLVLRRRSRSSAASALSLYLWGR